MAHDLCARTALHLVSLSVKNFRCFDVLELDLNHPIVLIEGNNGSGKTSILEALYFACYLRSFRTHIPRDIISFEKNNFFLKMQVHRTVFEEQFDHEIQVGYIKGKRSVKVDQRAVYSYKDLLHGYKIISLTEDDLELIKGAPDSRRSFVDQSILLQDHDYAQLLRRIRTIVDNRNACLRQGPHTQEMLMILTEQLWRATAHIQQLRIQAIESISSAIQKLIKQFFNDSLTLSLQYVPKMEGHATFEEFSLHNKNLVSREYYMQRTLFGAHVDDIRINFQAKSSRLFASRGQQKLIVLLMKIGQIMALAQVGSPIFLLDDYMTDFDVNYAQLLISILTSLKSQLIFTAPVRSNDIMEQLRAQGAYTISLTP